MVHHVVLLWMAMRLDAEKVKALRAQQKLTVAALAAKAGTSRQTIDRYESGQRGQLPDVTILHNLAQALGVRMEDLLTE